MPRLTKRRSSRRESYTKHHYEALSTGHDWFRVFDGAARKIPTRGRNDYYSGNEAVDEQRRLAWGDLREEIMETWVHEHPFTRPDGWWRYDAPERRRCLSGMHPHDDPAWPSELPKWLTQGKPRCMAVVPSDFKAVYESERDYLIRLDLLTEHERALLAQETPAAESVIGDGL